MGTNPQPIHTADPYEKQSALGSQIQIPLSVKRQGTGQKVMEKQPQYTTKVLPQSSSGYTWNGSRVGASKYEEILAGRTNSVYAGIPKPNVQSAVSRQNAQTHQNYNSTSAAGYQSNQVTKSTIVDN